ncbi:MAG: AarF/ABC1/UbiB kinase family protein, partial [Pseudomonadota bacterium]
MAMDERPGGSAGPRRTSAEPAGRSVPAGRIARVAGLGGTVGGIAANMAARGIGEIAQGRRPAFRDLLLTPGNIGRLTDELARLRGAAMKLGQLISMDAGDMLPPELAEIMARLRMGADPMPPQQLKTVLTEAWGKSWLRQFRSFETTPIAAASIGQVHRGVTKEGARLAIKVQYPGVRESIDSDVDNVGTLLRLSGLMPDGVDPAPFLAEAKRQLHQEADYGYEAGQLRRYAALMEGLDDYRVPALHEPLCTREVLVMSYEPGEAVEARLSAPQAERDRIAHLLLDLCFREIYGFGLVQTDPNFANYRYDPETSQIVLLDFGASREVPGEMMAPMRALMQAAMADDRAAMAEAALAVGFVGPGTEAHHTEGVVAMMAMAVEPFRTNAPY